MHKKEKITPSLFGVAFVLIVCALYFFGSNPIQHVINSLENWSYGIEVRNAFKPLDKKSDIAIIDIDDQSLHEIGRWPWPRNRLAELVEKVHALGASVLAFDITFPEREPNIVDQVAEKLPQSKETLDSVRQTFDYDEQLAQSLRSQKSVLGIVFTDSGKSEGVLPPPLPGSAEKLDIRVMKEYLANIRVLQDAAQNGGFINADPDADGVLRFSPLVLRYGDHIYPSLGLIAASLFLKSDQIKLIAKEYRNTPVLEGIQLGDRKIPTDPWGRILIPFRGHPYSFNYLSASSVLKGEVPREQIEGKLLFVGSTATAIGDLKATPMAPIFAGVEVQASIASGIIDNYLPYRPAWGKGANLFALLILGLICALTFPHLGPIALFAWAIILPLALIALNIWLWTHYFIVLYAFMPIFAIEILFIANLIYGDYVAANRRKEIQAIFGQYVPPEYLEIMLEKGEEINLDGVSKEMSVLFADIFKFTTLSEKMSAPELKHLLNEYLTPMTEVIFNRHGTIDKYVGDMVMAFWGAPLENLRHAFTAVVTALEMQARLKALNLEFKQRQLPEIRIGIGVNTGIMNVGDMGSKFRRAYTVLSDAVNLGSRLEGLTRLYQVGVIVGENTQQQTVNDFVYRKLDKVRVAGKEKAVEIYEPICLKSQSSPALEEQVQKHHAALEKYFQRNWDQAEKLFEELEKNSPLYGVYLKRIVQFRQNPPPSDWDGATKLENK